MKAETRDHPRIRTALAFPLALAFCALQAFASGKAAVGPEAALEVLKEGNARFAEGQRTYPDLGAARLAETAAKGQQPFATILYCADSRVPVEHIFDAGVGDLFGVRVAGNVADTDEIGTIEYGTEHLGTPLVLVLGHSSCGAVTAVAKGDEVGGSIPLLVDNILPAVERAKEDLGEGFSPALLEAAIEENVWQAISDLLSRSAIVRELVEAGKLKLEGAIYHLDTGKVEWLGEHAREGEIIEAAGLSLAAPKAEVASGRKEIDGIPAIAVWAICAILCGALALAYLKLFSKKWKTKSVKVASKLLIAGGASAAVPMVALAILAADPSILGRGDYVLLAVLGLTTLGALGFALASMRSIGGSITAHVRKLEKEIKEGAREPSEN